MHLIYSSLGLAICLQCARWVLWEMGYYSIGWPAAILLVCVMMHFPRAGPVLWAGGWIWWPLKVSFKLDCSVAAFDGCYHSAKSTSCRNRWEPIVLSEGPISPALSGTKLQLRARPALQTSRKQELQELRSLVLSYEHYFTVFVTWAPSESRMGLTYL